MVKEGRKEMLYLIMHSTILSTVIWHRIYGKGRKEGNVLFNDALNTFYLRSYGVGHMVKEGRKEMLYLMMHSTHFIYGYMASDIL